MCRYYLYFIFSMYYGIQFLIVNGIPITSPSLTSISSKAKITDLTELNESESINLTNQNTTRFSMMKQKLLYPIPVIMPIYNRDQISTSMINKNENNSNNNNEFSKSFYVNHLQNNITKTIESIEDDHNDEDDDYDDNDNNDANNMTLTEIQSTKESEKPSTIIGTTNTNIIVHRKIKSSKAASFPENSSTTTSIHIHKNRSNKNDNNNNNNNGTTLISNTTEKFQNIDFIFPNDDDYLDYEDDKISASAIASILG